ncbi:hypothetical protein Y032_0290g1529 [Ancylostoma ceylanicum]|uniref:Uncharacterized protein n=1 Tax=Ancylostoma ceylanicum TaxID=53326 RepID=A0A016S613_9BILA|nr:hypothetical protein Y032_0290g1529 [Ancylostoma ceylanicum]
MIASTPEKSISLVNKLSREGEFAADSDLHNEISWSRIHSEFPTSQQVTPAAYRSCNCANGMSASKHQ